MKFKLMIAQPRRVALLFMCLILTLPIALVHASESEPAASEEGEAQTIYVDMTPAFVTQVGTPGQRLSYLKANVTLRVSSKAAEDAVKTHMPRLRHELVMLFSAQTDTDQLSSGEGQDALKKEALARINKVLEDQHREERVDDVLFTTFVVQR